MRISIHQPNFFPHYPFFQKMEESDLFVLLTHCQFEKNKYQNRFLLNKTWHTMSVISGMMPIKDKLYDKPYFDWDRIKHRLNGFQDILSVFDYCISHDLASTNSLIISTACNLLGIKTEIKYDYKTDLKATDRLVDICKHYGANEYLSGISGKKYLDLKKFDEAGIKVIFQDESKMIKKALIECL